MKKYIRYTWLLLALFLTAGTVNAQESDSLGTIGDNLNLQAVLDAFKTAETVESFENEINTPSNKINNLDLNEDGEVDYIQVIDNVEEDAHALILRIEVSEEESQDVAVIELEKTGDNNALIQLIGDEELYGEDYIVEPIDAITTGNMPPAFVTVNVWGWPAVRFIYGASYKPWKSPWRWQHYPSHWKPWKPYKKATYHSFHKHHQKHYNVVHVHRTGHAHKIYHKHRKSWKHIKNHNHHHNNHKKVHKNGHKNAHKKANKGGNKKAHKNAHKKKHKH